MPHGANTNDDATRGQARRNGDEPRRPTTRRSHDDNARRRSAHDDPRRQRERSKQQGRRKSRSQPTPSTRRQRARPTRETPLRHTHGTATASNRQQRPRRTKTETQTAIAPPHLSNKRGAKRYDDRAERIASRHDGGMETPRTRGRKQARQGEAIAAREATNNRATTSDDDARRQQRPATHVERTGREARRERPSRGIQFVLIAHPSREPSHPIHHQPSAVSICSPQTAGAWEDTERHIAFI